MTQPLATIAALKERLDWVLDAAETRVAMSALEDASEYARFHGRDSWVSEATAPPLVRTLVLRACERHMKNLEGLIQSRAGDETVTYPDEDPEMGTVHFTEIEIKQLERLAGRGQKFFGTVVLSSWGTKISADRVGLVPVDYGGKAIQMYQNDTDNW